MKLFKHSKFEVSLKSLKGRFGRVACVIFILLVSLSFTGCNTATTKVASLEWRVIAEIQQLKPCDESGWEVPEGATVYKEQEEIKSYKIVGYETKYRVEEYQEVVGYILPTWRPRYETRTRTVPYQVEIRKPVYATKYYYTIDRWVPLKHILLACGDKQDYNYDQDYNYTDYVCAENERILIEYEYLLKLECDVSQLSRIVDRDTWESLQVGQEISGKKDEYGCVDWDYINTTNE